jgi:hypothetical protein
MNTDMRLLACAALVTLGIGGTVRADIIFDPGNTPGGDNVLFNTAIDIIGPATTLRGHIGNTTTQVDIVGAENLLVNNSGGGQATIAAVDGGFTTADIFLTTPPGGVFTQIVFALSGDQQTTSTFNITATEGNGTVQTSSPFSFNSGNSFFTVVAINGQDIRNVDITTSSGEIDTLKQIRIGGFSPTPTSVVPEPASVVLFGTALVAIVFLYRKRFAAAR